ncbi:MAG: hypothetical protein ACRCY8_15355 [Dermatophilaceae bacterium]
MRDIAADIRAGRTDDITIEDAKWARVDARVAEDDRPEDEVTVDLLGSLGLT